MEAIAVGIIAGLFACAFGVALVVVNNARQRLKAHRATIARVGATLDQDRESLSA